MNASNVNDGLKCLSSVRVGSRESELAQVQARWVMAALESYLSASDAEVCGELSLKTFKTKGDIELTAQLSKIGDKGLFVKELEVALLAGDIDLAVHSMKDMPGEVPEGLVLLPIGEREDSRDVMIARESESGSCCELEFKDLPSGVVVGTSSTRRLAMLKRVRPDLEYKNIRGNLNTRLRKLDSGDYDVIILAAAGVHRLGWKDRVTQYFDPVEELIPAPGQGVLAVECRAGDTALINVLRSMTPAAVAASLRVERAALTTLQAGCHTPLGVHAWVSANEVTGAEELRVVGSLLSENGVKRVVAERRAVWPKTSDFGLDALGKSLAEELQVGFAEV